MKKLVLFFAVVVAVSFASCGNKAESNECAADSTVVVEEVAAVQEVVADSADTTVVAETVVAQ